MTRHLLWARLADQRPGRELSWLARMPGTRVTEVGSPRTHLPPSEIDWRPSRFRRPVRRFVEAGAFAWQRDLADVPPEYDWCASLELFSLVTGQLGRWARRTGTRQLVVLWGNDVHHPLHLLPPYRQALQESRRADLYLCLIDGARDHLLEMGFDDERIRVVKPGVDTAVFHPADHLAEEPVVAFVSPLAPNKGIDRVLDAFALVRRAVPGARLEVMGRGPLEGLVREVASEPGSGVRLVPAGGPEQVAATLRSASLFVTAPRANRVWNEQFGLAYVEAMACGLPVVTTRCGTNHEAVVPPNVLVDDDLHDLADAIAQALGDLPWRRRVGAGNRAHVLREHELQRQCDAMGAALASVE